MPVWGDVLVGIVILVGLVGVVVQVLPGATMVGGAVAVWGVVTGGRVGWTVAVLAVVLTLVAMVVKLVVAGRYLQRQGVPSSSSLIGAVLGVVGFFVIPVVGVFIGFPLGVYLAERVRRRQHAAAWRSTVASMKASGLTILVELAASLIVATAWVAGLLLR